MAPTTAPSPKRSAVRRLRRDERTERSILVPPCRGVTEAECKTAPMARRTSERYALPVIRFSVYRGPPALSMLPCASRHRHEGCTRGFQHSAGSTAADRWLLAVGGEKCASNQSRPSLFARPLKRIFRRPRAQGDGLRRQRYLGRPGQGPDGAAGEDLGPAGAARRRSQTKSGSIPPYIHRLPGRCGAQGVSRSRSRTAAYGVRYIGSGKVLGIRMSSDYQPPTGAPARE
jgi:hypothetical protein